MGWKHTLVVGASLMLFSMSNIAEAAVEVGDAPYPYLGSSIDGDKIALEQYLGKVVVVTFWASWCAPCLQELPVLDAIQKKAGAELMQVIAVNYKEDRKRYRKLQKVLSEASTGIIFTHDEKGKIGDKYGVEGLPSLFVIGKDGRVSHHSVGYGEASLDKLVEVLNTALQ